MNYPKHYCGIFGIQGMPDAAKYAYSGLFSLQHRGQESAGIVTCHDGMFFKHHGMGLVSQVFTDAILRDHLRGDTAIGHNRYATTGNSEIRNAQPLSIQCKHGDIALAHNGNLTNTRALKAELEKSGAAFQTTTDSEVMLLLLAQSEAPLDQAILDMMDRVEGAYSLVIMTKDLLIAVRDPHGFRPLSLGMLDGNPVIASETCALDTIGAHFEREVDPGEIVIFEGNKKPRTLTARSHPKKSFCSFEHVYFAHPDSIIGGRSVYSIRKEMGHQLAREHPIEADLVMPVPDSGICAALGYHEESGIQFDLAFIRNHYVGRSFIQPTQVIRDFDARIKLNLIVSLVKGKRVIIVDDSIVRGTTSRMRVKTIKEAGAREVHMLISCPPHRYPCYYGIDFPDRSKLVAANHTVEEIRKNLGLDSLGYLSEEGLSQILGPGHCMACWNGKYPVTSKDAMAT